MVWFWSFGNAWNPMFRSLHPHFDDLRDVLRNILIRNTSRCSLVLVRDKKEVCLVIERVIYVLPMTVSFAHILLLDRCSSLRLRGNWEMLSPGQFHITIGAQFVVWHLIEPSFWHAPWNSVSHRTRPEHLDQWRAQKDINRSIVVNPKIKPVAATSWNMLLQPKPVDQSWSR